MVLIMKTVLVCSFPYLCVCMYISACICSCVCICVWVYVRMYMCICICVYLYVHRHMCLCICLCVYVYDVLCMCMVYVCICVYIYFLASEHWLSLLPSWTGRKCSFLMECSELWVFHRWLVLVRSVLFHVDKCFCYERMLNLARYLLWIY